MQRDQRIARAASRSRSRAFTLVEMMIVVAIVGVLAVIAVVSYRKLTTSAKVSEAQNMISTIRIAQESYKVERGTYLDLTALTWCPSDGLAQAKTDWYRLGCEPWLSLPVHVDGPLRFGYKTQAGLGGTTPASTWVTIPTATIGPWYVIEARADLDGNGGLLTELVGTSFENTIFSRQEGL